MFSAHSFTLKSEQHHFVVSLFFCKSCRTGKAILWHCLARSGRAWHSLLWQQSGTPGRVWGCTDFRVSQGPSVGPNPMGPKPRGTQEPLSCATVPAALTATRAGTSLPQQGSSPLFTATSAHSLQVQSHCNYRVSEGLLYLKKSLTPEGYSTFYNMGSTSAFSHYQTRKLLRKSRHRTDLLQSNAQNCHFNFKVNWTSKLLGFFLKYSNIYLTP